jgi:hypothetical protein
MHYTDPHCFSSCRTGEAKESRFRADAPTVGSEAEDETKPHFRRRTQTAQRRPMKVYWATKAQEPSEGTTLLPERFQPLHVGHYFFQSCFEQLRQV